LKDTHRLREELSAEKRQGWNFRQRQWLEVYICLTSNQNSNRKQNVDGYH